MPFGVDDALAAGAGIANGISSAITGNASATNAKYAGLRDTYLQYAEWLRSQGLQDASAAMAAQRDTEKLGLRDKLQYLIGSRMGLPVGQASYERGALPGMNATSPTNEYNRLASMYTSGAGGVDMSGRVQHQLMNSLGYGTDGTQSLLNMHRANKPGESTEDYIKSFGRGLLTGDAQRGADAWNPNYNAPTGNGGIGGRIPTSPFLPGLPGIPRTNSPRGMMP